MDLQDEKTRQIFNYLIHKQRINFDDLICGSYIIIRGDHGSVFFFFKNNFGAYERFFASHYSKIGTFEIDLKDCCIIFGIDQQGDTWLQFEQYNTMVKNWIRHLLSWVEYNVHNQNVGPLCNSTFTERNPRVYYAYDHGRP
jgi:hypothetical protein